VPHHALLNYENAVYLLIHGMGESGIQIHGMGGAGKKVHGMREHYTGPWNGIVWHTDP